MPENCPISFEQAIAQVANISPESRNLQIKSHFIRLLEAHQGPNYWEGDLIRIRMDEMPLKASLAGPVTPLDLADDEGVGEETAFYYHPPSRVLLFQYNRHSVSASMASYYFRRMAGIEGDIVLEPVLQEDVLVRLARMRIFRKFIFKVSGEQNAQVFQGQGHGVGALTDLIHQFQAPTIEVTLSLGRKRRGSLGLQAVKDTIERLLRFAAGSHPQVERLQIAGREGDGDDIRFIDLLKDRMIEMVHVPLDASRRVPPMERRRALQSAWLRRQEEVLRMYSP
ncbi:MAG: DUF6731 family protein [Candidatus Methanomethylicaceae archaeon]